MNYIKLKEMRLQNQIEQIEKNIYINLVKNGMAEICIYLPEDLFGSIKDYLNDKGFNIRRERVEYRDIDGFGTGEYGFNNYISLK